jgi:hypothetical protein
MKLHTDYLSARDIANALFSAQDSGLVSKMIHFTQFASEGSRSRKYGYLVQLGSDVQETVEDSLHKAPHKRFYKNSGQYGASSVWAATYDEWGWFISALFLLDSDAIFGYYKNAADFHEKTDYKFEIIEHRRYMN